MFEIRHIDDDQLPAWVEMRNRTDPEMPVTVEETAFWADVDPGRANLVAFRDGEAVGAGLCHLDTADRDATFGEGKVWVPQENRGQGIGGGLVAACRDHLRGLGRETVRGEIRGDDQHTVDFLERRGFRELARSQMVGLDLTAWQPPGWPLPDGIVLTDFASRPDLLRGMSRVEHEVVADIPPQGGEPHTPFPFEQFEKLVRKPGLDPRLTIIALDGEEVVGYAMLSVNVVNPTIGYHWLTGVRTQWRGRGVARALKQAQLVAAKGMGVESVRTDNDLRNAPIRRLNEALGYVRRPDIVLMEARLADIPDGRPR